MAGIKAKTVLAGREHGFNSQGCGNLGLAIEELLPLFAEPRLKGLIDLPDLPPAGSGRFPASSAFRSSDSWPPQVRGAHRTGPDKASWESSIGMPGQLAEPPVNRPSVLRVTLGGMGSWIVAERTRMPGGRRPKNRSIRASVTWSYFAPPIPCKNKSLKTKRAQSVVTNARERISNPFTGKFQQVLRRRLCSAAGSKGQGDPDLLPVRQRQFSAIASDEQPAAARIVRRPDPKRCLQPTVLLGQIRNRVPRAADMVDLPVFVDRLVVGGHKPWQIGQHACHEPGERGQPADVALRQLQRLEPPLSFHLVPRLGQAFPRLAVARRCS